MCEFSLKKKILMDGNIANDAGLKTNSGSAVQFPTDTDYLFSTEKESGISSGTP